MALQQFEAWLEGRAHMPTTRNVYLCVVRSLMSLCGENPSIEQANAFILQRAERQYFIFLGRGGECEALAKVRLRKPMKERTYLTDEQAEGVVRSMLDDGHKALFVIQMGCCCRASEVLRMKKKHLRVSDDLKV